MMQAHRPNITQDVRRSTSSSGSGGSQRRGEGSGIGVHNLRDVQGCFEPLHTLAGDLGIPFACLRLDRHGATDRKTFFDRGVSLAASTPSNPSAAVLPPLLPPTPNPASEPRETAESNIDEHGGNTIFAIGSLVKLLINLAFCVLICQDKPEGLAWDAKAFGVYNDICDRNDEPPIARLERDPTILELLLHRNSFAPMIRFLLAPDGTFLPTRSEFLEYAVPISNHFFRTQNPDLSTYSNANHIFAALLLEKVTGKAFSTFMYERLLEPLGLRRTFLDFDSFSPSMEQGNVTQGHRISMDLLERNPSGNTYLGDTIEAASFGARSCTNDLAALVQELFTAVNGESQILSKETTQYFFGTFGEPSEVNPTLGGLYCTLDSGALGSESLNVYARSSEANKTFSLGTRAKKSVFVHYKGGITDGFTCCLYISVLHKTSIIVLSNANGPIDFCDYAARYMLQAVFDTRPQVDVLGEARSDLESARKFLTSVYSLPTDRVWSDDVGPFVGDFQHVVHRQKLSITTSGHMIMSGGTNKSQPFKVAISGSIIRIVLKETDAVVDSRHEWKDLNFELTKKLGKYYLLGSGGADYYEKL